MMACGTCGCFVDEERTDMHTPYDGECRLEPPKIVPLGDGDLCCFFPMVNKEDWCKQWIERGEE